jgi:hypothetical protein
MKTTLPKQFVPLELWTRATELAACRETKDATAGAPYYIAYQGRIQCVTRRCAVALRKAGTICGSMPARDPGSGGLGFPALKAVAHGQAIGLTFRLSVVKPGTWMLHCPEMHCEMPTTNPARDMMILSAEWMTLVESDFAGCEGF